MWRRVLQFVVESCVYVDPFGYMCYVVASQAAAEQSPNEQVEIEEHRIRLLIERLESRRGAQA